MARTPSTPSLTRGRPLTPARGELGGRVRRARLAGGWSVTAFAAHVRVSPGYVSLLERGHRQPSLAVYRRLFPLLEPAA